MPIIIGSLMQLIQPYWFWVGKTFGDSYNENSRDLRFEVNDALLFCAIFIKLLPIYNYFLERS